SWIALIFRLGEIPSDFDASAPRGRCLRQSLTPVGRGRRGVAESFSRLAARAQGVEKHVKALRLKLDCQVAIWQRIFDLPGPLQQNAAQHPSIRVARLICNP